MKKSNKLKNDPMVNEEFGMKPYIKNLTAHEARIFFKHRSKMTRYIKMNYKGDPVYEKQLWKCD